MAHASEEKEGKKGHASFDKATFYRLNPDLLLCENMRLADAPNDALKVRGDTATWLKHITEDAEFWRAYRSVVIAREGHDQRVPVIASVGFLAKARSQGYRVETWDQYRGAAHPTMAQAPH
jgi:hypothetical protein